MSTAHVSQSSAPLLDGKYSLLRQIGSGAAGAVYEAENLIVGKRVAVKVLNPALARNSTLSARFVAEARAAARIGHANVVDIYDFGITRDGLSYIVMELLKGETLSEILEARGPIAPGYACELMVQVLGGLAAAHATGIIHRDLKPANVIVTHPRPDRPLVKVLDFGVAKIAGNSIRDESVLGTPMYMSPEQALGNEVDERADVYSAAAMLYEMLAGRALFSGSTAMEVMSQVLVGKFVPLRQLNPSLPPELTAVVERALALDPQDRFQSAEELTDHLLPFVARNKSSSLAPRTFLSQSPIPLVPAEARAGLGASSSFMLNPQVSEALKRSFPPVELIRMDRWSGERAISHSLLESPRIPRAPSPPRLNRREGAPDLDAPYTASQMFARRTTLPNTARRMIQRWRGAFTAILIGFAIGLVVALFFGTI